MIIHNQYSMKQKEIHVLKSKTVKPVSDMFFSTPSIQPQYTSYTVIIHPSPPRVPLDVAADRRVPCACACHFGIACAGARWAAGDNVTPAGHQPTAKLSTSARGDYLPVPGRHCSLVIIWWGPGQCFPF